MMAIAARPHRSHQKEAARRRRIGRRLYREYCAGATMVELLRWYGRYGLTEARAWQLMIAGMRRGAHCLCPSPPTPPHE